MPWEKQFDVDDALTRAMHAFWSRGYEATSMQDLVARMGVNRASIYATFGNKHSLFVHALRRYDREHRREWLTRLRDANGPRRAILAAFESARLAARRAHGSDGCLLVNTALELSPHDPEVAAIVADGLRETEHIWREMIEAGQSQGEIPEHVEALATARSLLGLFVGLRVLARGRPEAALLKSITNQAAALLN